MTPLDDTTKATYFAELIQLLHSLPQDMTGAFLFQIRLTPFIEKIWNDGYTAAMTAVINEKHTKE
jgi:hypothetical protein